MSIEIPRASTLPCPKCGAGVYNDENSPYFPYCRCPNCNQGYEMPDVFGNLLIPRDDLPKEIPAISKEYLHERSWDGTFSPNYDHAAYTRALEITKNYRSSKNRGCYIATAIYGSYDCPQVWTLRRYRDYSLAETWCGRLFIRVYYAISPALVRWFGKTEWFRNLWKPKLDRMVERLNNEGVENTPYADRDW